MEKMTKQQWLRINYSIESGDPIKDVADEEDLINYILELRKRLKLADDEP